jgi:hypothetical protein
MKRTYLVERKFKPRHLNHLCTVIYNLRKREKGKEEKEGRKRIEKKRGEEGGVGEGQGKIL